MFFIFCVLGCTTNGYGFYNFEYFFFRMTTVARVYEQNWSEDQTEQLMQLLSRFPAEKYNSRADRLRDIQKELPERTLTQITSKV